MSATTVNQDAKSPLPFPKEVIRSDISHDKRIKQELETVKKSVFESIGKGEKKKFGKKRKYDDLEAIFKNASKAEINYKKRKLEKENESLRDRIFMLEKENEMLRQANAKFRGKVTKMKGCKVKAFDIQ